MNNNLQLTLSRFMYAPRTLGELALAIFGWMLLAAVVAVFWILIETLLTPAHKYWDPNHKQTAGFWLSWLYVAIFTVVFVVYCVLPMHLPALDAFFKHLDTIRI